MPLPLLSESRSWTGRWWLPEDTDNKVAGVLTYVPGEGLTLRLVGGWEYRILATLAPGVTTAYEGMQKRWPAVHGIAENKRITLLDLQVANAISFGALFAKDEPDQMELIAVTALVGCHLDAENDAEFVGGSATIENMTAWARESAIEHEMNYDQQTNRLEGGEIRYRHIVESRKAMFGDVQAELQHLLTIPDFERTRGAISARVVERTCVKFSSDEPRPLREWLQMMSGMSDLLSLSTLTACTEITLLVWTPATPDAYPEKYPLRDRQHEIEVYEQRVVTPDPDRKDGDSRRFVLTLDDLPFDSLIPRWLEVKDQFSSVLSMVLGLSYITDGYLQTRVVTAVGAAESFHRSLSTEPPMPHAEFKSLRESLLETVAPERRQWLADRIARNEPSLRERLLELARLPGGFMDQLLPDAESWAKEATRARNGLAHVGRSDDHTLEDLYAVTEVTRAVVILNLLSQLGVPNERLAKGLAEHAVLREAARLGKRHYPLTNVAVEP